MLWLKKFFFIVMTLSSFIFCLETENNPEQSLALQASKSKMHERLKQKNAHALNFWALQDQLKNGGPQSIMLQPTLFSGQIKTLACDDMSNIVAAGTDRGEIIIFHAIDGQKQLQWRAEREAEIVALAFSPLSDKIASISLYDPYLYIWNIQRGSIVFKLEHEELPYLICFNEEGTLIASVTQDQNIHIWNAYTGQKLQQIKSNKKSTILKSVFIKDGRSLLAISRDGNIKIYDARTGIAQSALSLIANDVISICDIQRNLIGFTSQGAANKIKIFDINTKKIIQVLDYQKPIDAIAIDETNLRIIAAYADGNISIRDVSTGNELLRIGMTDQNIIDICASKNSSFIAFIADNTKENFSTAFVYHITNQNIQQLINQKMNTKQILFLDAASIAAKQKNADTFDVKNGQNLLQETDEAQKRLRQTINDVLINGAASVHITQSPAD